MSIKLNYNDYINPPHSWCAAPETIVLQSDEIHIWRASLDQSESYVHRMQQILVPDELRRAKCYYFDRDRMRFIISRGLLRTLLGFYLKKEPREIQFCYGHYGKPELAGQTGRDALRFNISRSHGLSLMAITRGRELGIDLERIRSDMTYESIAERFFSPRENAMLHSLPNNIKPTAFFNCWTRKEAYIKARGVGLSIPLDQFDVSLIPGEPASLLSTKDSGEEITRWSLQELHPRHGCVAALAAEGHGWHLKCWQWQD